MAIDFTPEQRGYLKSSEISICFLLDLFTDTTSMHCSNLFHSFSYDFGDGGGTIFYEPLGDRWSHGDDTLNMGNDSSPEPLTIEFDASRLDDNNDFVGRFMDAAWHRRRARFSVMLFVPGTGRVTPVKDILNWQGEMDFRDEILSVNSPPRLQLSLESGTIRYLGRNLQTRTDENQKKLFPGDAFFQDMPSLIGNELPWHRKFVSATANSVRYNPKTGKAYD